jgi:hypothetical protein
MTNSNIKQRTHSGDIIRPLDMPVNDAKCKKMKMVSFIKVINFMHIMMKIGSE